MQFCSTMKTQTYLRSDGKGVISYVNGVLLESNSTFTGLPKPSVFASHREQFKFVDSRLTYGQIPGRFKKGENPFFEEAYQRLALDYLLEAKAPNDDCCYV
ncbi:hypothetical protein Leryth_002272 [Lithospermum erythrorhizon]|nr:hypothetical protein Leryth_002272 [Lithospermum erythrorhizon]